ncbi:MAG: hypothetical protein MSG64_16660 [Pyrinomonadaceae bacterium MAG19_C2-C3]|nr:hypothetical protein [Pyrinomonadaceae bacterium MAG19_C2-C3]
MNPSFDDCPAVCALALERDGVTVDRPDFCSECEVRRQWEFFRDAVIDDLQQRKLTYDFDSLYADCARVLQEDGRLRGRGYSRSASVLEVRLLSIVRDERARPERVRLWNLERQLETERNKR